MAQGDKSLKKQKAAALKRAIEEAGGPSQIAHYITENFDKGITPQAVLDWKVCPPMRAPQVAAAAQAKGGKTTIRDLCPDFAQVFEQAA
jgi:hypothetical protein